MTFRTTGPTRLAFALLLPGCIVCGSRTFDVTSYGAVGDGTHKDTSAIRKAAAALHHIGGGTLLFPTGHTFLTGAFNISSNTVLEVQGTIMGSSSGDDWPLVDALAVWPQMGHGSDCTGGNCRWMHQALIFGWNIVNVTISGGGAVDGHGASWWACADALDQAPCGGFPRPHLLMMSNSSRVRVANISFSNSPDWTLHFSSVTHLHIHHIRIDNPSSPTIYDPNADGIDLDCVQDVLIEHSEINAGDDALCVKSGIDWLGRQYGRPSRDIVFRDVRVGGGHGITIGSETSGGVHNVTFERISLNGTLRGPRIKSQRGRGGVVSDITFRDLVAHNVGTLLTLNLEYHPGLPPTNASATPVLRNVLMDRITAYTTPDGAARAIGNPNVTGELVAGKERLAGVFDGLPESVIANVTLRDVRFVGDQPLPRWGACGHVVGACEGVTAHCPPCFADRSRRAATESLEFEGARKVARGAEDGALRSIRLTGRQSSQ